MTWLVIGYMGCPVCPVVQPSWHEWTVEGRKIMNLRKIRFAEWIEAPGAFNVFEVQEGGEVPLGTVVRFTVGWGAFPQLDQLEGIIAGFDTRDEAVVFLLGANLMLNLIHSRGF